jgi:6-pyruvoyl-tetrahydropterin synthase
VTLRGTGVGVLTFNFEAAHRQPKLTGKCYNLHGHSWLVEVSIQNTGHPNGVNPATGLSIEFTTAKTIMRTWIEQYFDHASLLGVQDDLLPALREDRSKVFTFGEGGDFEGLPWPTVEAVAFCLGMKFSELLVAALGEYARVTSVMVTETDTNSFCWHPSE